MLVGHLKRRIPGGNADGCIHMAIRSSILQKNDGTAALSEKARGGTYEIYISLTGIPKNMIHRVSDQALRIKAINEES